MVLFLLVQAILFQLMYINKYDDLSLDLYDTQCFDVQERVDTQTHTAQNAERFC